MNVAEYLEDVQAIYYEIVLDGVLVTEGNARRKMMLNWSGRVPTLRFGNLWLKSDLTVSGTGRGWAMMRWDTARLVVWPLDGPNFWDGREQEK